MLLALLGGICWFYARESVDFWAVYPRIQAAGDRLDGRVVRFPLWEVTAIAGPRRLEISKVIRDIPVEGDTTGLKLGDTVSVVGNFRAADDVVVASVLYVHRYRKWKERLGILGMMLSLLAAPLGFAWRAGRLVERG